MEIVSIEYELQYKFNVVPELTILFFFQNAVSLEMHLNAFFVLVSNFFLLKLFNFKIKCFLLLKKLCKQNMVNLGTFNISIQ